MNLLQYQNEILGSYLEQLEDNDQKAFVEKYKQLNDEDKNVMLQSLASQLPEFQEMLMQETPQMSFQDGGFTGEDYLYDANGNFIGDNPEIGNTLEQLAQLENDLNIPEMEDFYTADDDYFTIKDMVNLSTGQIEKPSLDYYVRDGKQYYYGDDNEATMDDIAVDLSQSIRSSDPDLNSSNLASNVSRAKKRVINPQLKEQQRQLYEAGYFGNISERKAIDGIYGPLTQAAMERRAAAQSNLSRGKESLTPRQLDDQRRLQEQQAFQESNDYFRNLARQSQVNPYQDFYNQISNVENLETLSKKEQLDLARQLNEKGLIGTAMERTGLNNIQVPGMSEYKTRVKNSLDDLYNSEEYKNADTFIKMGMIAERDPLKLLAAGASLGTGLLGLGKIPYKTQNFPVGTNELPRSKRVDIERGLPQGRSDDLVTPMGMGYDANYMPQSAREYNIIANNATNINSQKALPYGQSFNNLPPATSSLVPNRRKNPRVENYRDNSVTNLPESARQTNWNIENKKGIDNANSFINEQIQRLKSPTGMSKKDIYSSYRQARKDLGFNGTYEEYQSLLKERANIENLGFRHGGSVNPYEFMKKYYR